MGILHQARGLYTSFGLPEFWYFGNPDVFKGSNGTKAKNATPFSDLLRTLNIKRSEMLLKWKAKWTQTKIAYLGSITASILG